ncbi:MAG TPA: hypothetical protein DDW23_04840 [Planctomycetes bacterium]|nr:hypothetical protein [Planctomycetota bacterium]
MSSIFRQFGLAPLKGGLLIGIGLFALAFIFLVQDPSSEERGESGDLASVPIGELEEVAESAPEVVEAGPLPLPGTGPLVVEMRWLGSLGFNADNPAGTATLLGRVVDERGAALSGAEIQILGGPQAGKTTRSSSSGEYRLLGLVPGAQFLSIRVPGRLPVARIQRAGARRSFSRNFVVGSPVSIEVLIRNHEGDPLEGARVETDFGTQAAFSDKEGKALLAQVPSSPRTPLDIKAEGYVPIRYELDLLGKPQAGPIEVSLPPLTQGAAIQGRVTSWPGGDLPRVTVVPRARQPGAIQPIWEMWQDLEVDPAGRFRLEGLPFQVVDVRVFHSSGVASPRVRTVRPSSEFATTVDFVIRAGEGRVHGKVVNMAGEPLSGVRVSLEAENPSAVLGRLYPGLDQSPGLVRLPVPAAVRRTIVTNKSGGFDFAIGDHPKGSGALVLLAEGPGLEPLRRIVKVAQSDVVLEMRPESRRGSIYLEARAGVEIPPVEWYLEGEALPSREGLVEGTYSVTVSRGGEIILSREALQVRGGTSLKIGR